MKLSLLDRSRTRVNSDGGQVDSADLQAVVQRARHAEELGFHRFWVAEHHAVPGIASGSPAVLLAAIGQVTSSIRLGSGGVMLPQHQPLIVAEQFRLLEGLFPARVDLGIGRSVGFTEPVRQALRRQEQNSDEYRSDLTELLGYLDDTGTVTARPVTDPVPVFTLATGSGMDIAAALGLPVVVGGPIVRSPEISDLLARYRENFRPSASTSGASEPYVIVSLDAYIADTTEAARDLALPEAWAMAMSRQQGEFPPLESPEAIHEYRWSGQVERRVGKQLGQVAAGTAAEVHDNLSSIVQASGADELLFSTSTYSTADQLRLDEKLMAAMG